MNYYRYNQEKQLEINKKILGEEVKDKITCRAARTLQATENANKSKYIRQCLNCAEEFKVDNKFIRLCYRCKRLNQVDDS